MASQALYRKWRSQTFAEVVAQEHVTRTLRNAVRDGRVGHAYLFAGPRGTGKTSMARLLAKAVNCIGDTDDKPCNRCRICTAINEGRSLDLIEIDAASNRGIDEVRELRDKVGFRPNECRYRVYILDEAHMLTTPAFNALLKTLEEPPEHVIFVLVTTEPHSIPLTILSRCQRFDFRRIPLADIVGHLRRVATEEGLQVSEEALEAIARQATGSMRDALSLLDQLMAYRGEEITLQRVQEILGITPLTAVSALARALAEGDLSGGLHVLNEALDQGADPRQLVKELVEYLRGVLILQAGGDGRLLNVADEMLAQMQHVARQLPLSRVLTMIRAFNQAGLDLKGDVHPRLPLEVALVEALSGERPAMAQPEVAEQPAERERQPAPVVREAPAASQPLAAAQATVAAEKQEEKMPTPVTAEHALSPATSQLTLEWFREHWREALHMVRERNRSVAALLTGSCEPIRLQGNVLTIGFYHDFHRERASQPKSTQIIETVLSELAGTRINVKCAPLERDERQSAPEQGGETKGEQESSAAMLDPLVQEALTKHGARLRGMERMEE